MKGSFWCGRDQGRWGRLPSDDSLCCRYEYILFFTVRYDILFVRGPQVCIMTDYC